MLDFGYYNMDCKEGMKEFPDKYFDLAVVDPPYYSGPEKRGYYGKSESTTLVKRNYYHVGESWELPDEEYFKELFRVSKNQIIFGINYFDVKVGPGRIVWDKCNGSSTFSDCEIAYCSLQNTVRLFRYMWNGMMQGKSIEEGHIMQGNKKKNEKRIHPTQKPVMLYLWILREYAHIGDKILDTNVGSASSLIACHRQRLQYVGFEKDKKYYIDSKKRLEEEMAQITIYDLEK